LDQTPRKQPAEPGVRRLPVVVEGKILGEGEVEDEAVPMAILGNMADSEVDDVLRAGTGDVLASDEDAARGDATKAGEARDQFGLPVSVDAGQADDLSFARLERSTPHSFQAPVVESPQLFDE